MQVGSQVHFHKMETILIPRTKFIIRWHFNCDNTELMLLIPGKPAIPLKSCFTGVWSAAV